MFYDNVLGHLVKKIVIVGNGSLNEFPRIFSSSGKLEFDAYQ